MALAIVLVVLVVGSVLFHIFSPWYLTPIASNWSSIDTTIDITFWVTGFVFVAVNLFLAYVVWKFRHKDDVRAAYEPENSKLEGWLTGITAIGVVAMLAPGLFVWAQFVNVPEEAHEFEAIGQQWHWSYRFPGEDGVFGKVDSRLITDINPFGMNPDDPSGQDDVLIDSPIVHLPIDEPVKALLRSKDVLHDFAVAEFRVKMDLVPGLVTFLWLTPTKLGTYDLLCEELCGVGHFAMRGKVVIEPREDFESWLATYPTYEEASQQKTANVDAGRGSYAVCAACHGQQGEGNPALNAPKLAGQGAWYVARQIKNYQTGRRGAHQDDVYGKQMAPMVATLVNTQAVANVAAYIASLPNNNPAEKTISGDLEHGKKLYRTCANCHGKQGQGIQALNAPRTAGMSDWYLARQLENFKSGVRGAHTDDIYGQQMALMAFILKDESSVNDLVAYMNSFN